jgi:hypothetical protein
MAATINGARAIGAAAAALERTELSAAMRIARYIMLRELPGLILGIRMIAYIVMSLAGLSP